MRKTVMAAALAVASLGFYARLVKTAEPVDVIEAATAAGHTEFVSAVAISELTDSAKQQGPPAPFTVFVPSNAAFAASGLAKTRDAMRPVIKFHVIPGKKLSKAQLTPAKLESIAGSNVEVLAGGQVKGAKETATVSASVECNNGFIHVIDKVLTPTEEE